MENRKDQILTVSARLFAEKGFAASSMRDISAELGVEAASLYSHIESKDEVLRKIIFPLAEELLNSLEEVNDIYFNGEEKLRMAIRQHVEILCRNLHAFQVFNYEWRHLTEPFRSKFVDMRDQYESGFRQIIQTGMDEHVFAPMDKKMAALTVLSSVNWIPQWFNPMGPLSPADVAESLSNMLIHGLKKQKPF